MKRIIIITIYFLSILVFPACSQNLKESKDIHSSTSSLKKLEESIDSLKLIIAQSNSQREIIDNTSSRKGVISKIKDGDSFVVIGNGIKTEIRLNGIDCPEYNQPYGNIAKNFTSNYLYHFIEYKTFGKDRYGRTIADIYINNSKLNELLVDKGLAWHYKAYSNDAILAEKETSARISKVGLWSEGSPIPPWDWRRNKSNKKIKNNSDKGNESGKVVVCGLNSTTKYHKDHECRGLINCKRNVYEIDINSAKNSGRAPCLICY